MCSTIWELQGNGVYGKECAVQHGNYKENGVYDNECAVQYGNYKKNGVYGNKCAVQYGNYKEMVFMVTNVQYNMGTTRRMGL